MNNKVRFLCFSVLAFLFTACSGIISIESGIVDAKDSVEVSLETHRTVFSEDVWRPMYHFTPESHWMNDPNGMVYYEGEYHLFYQYYPYGAVWGPMHWGHAVSTDMVHWERLPIALYPDENGYIFSGSAVIDWNNSAGLQTGEYKTMIAVFTHDSPSGQAQSIAYSTDKGRTWHKHPANPVLPNPGIADFRDPKVFWHESSGQWIMSLAAHDRILLYGSTNLVNWFLLSDFGAGEGSPAGVWECPDLFPLSVDGNNADQKWVLLVSINNGAPAGGSGTQYFIGSFDGVRFINDYPGETLWLDYGKDNYAGVSWSDDPDGRRVYVGWMSNWNYATATPASTWRGAMTLPRELALTRIGDRVCLVQNFIQELESIRLPALELNSKIVVPGVNELAGFNGSTYEIIAQFDDAGSSAQEYGFKVRTGDGKFTTVAYHRAEPVVFLDRRFTANSDFHPDFSSVIGQHMVSRNGKVRLHIFVDSSSVEVIGNNGLASLTDLIFPDPGHTGLELYSIGGTVLLDHLEIHSITSSAAPASPSPVFSTNTGSLTAKTGSWLVTENGLRGESSGDAFILAQNIGVLHDFRITSTVRLGTGGAAALAFRINESLSNGYVLNIDAGGFMKLWQPGGTILAQIPMAIVVGEAYTLTVEAVGTRIRAFLNNSPVPLIDITDSSSSCGYVGLNVWNGTSLFHTFNIEQSGMPISFDALQPVSGVWNSTSEGFSGFSSGDGFALLPSVGEMGDCEIEGDITLESAWAGALVLRGDGSANAGYVVNIDRGGFIKVWKIGGSILSMQNRTVLPGVEYHVRARMTGNRLQVWFDNEYSPLVDIVDNSRSSGYAGVNCWSGTALFRNARITKL